MTTIHKELQPLAPKAPDPVTSTDGRYRERWSWDEVRWASHCIDCYPGNCPMRVYLKDGKVVREESAAIFPVIQEGVPDMNPMGCQKGVGWTKMLDGKERILYPLKRVGERGSGKWERVTWEQAAREIGDAVLDAVEEVGGESVVAPSGCNISTWGGVGRGRYLGMVGGLTTDVNAEMNDFAPGIYLTMGRFDPVSSIDDWFHSEVFIIWFGNPNYTRIPHIHFVNEARYNGCEVITIAPDVSPSAVHADMHLPVKPGTDAALALSMCQVIIEEGLVDEAFVKEQTDLPLLMNRATKRYLRECDLKEGGSDLQLYAWDLNSNQLAAAPRANLRWEGVDPALEGAFTVEGKDGPITVAPVFSVVRERLQEYTPERAQEITNVHASTVRMLARKIASKRTNILGSLGNAGKYYHGDLVDRAQLLLLGLTGNWGKHGTGVRAWLAALFDGSFTLAAKTRRGPDDVAGMLDMREMGLKMMKAQDPSQTDMILSIEQAKASSGGGGMIAPLYWWYHHAGYRDAWNRADWHDPSMQRPFDEYFQEADRKGWWQGTDFPTVDQPTRVLIECGGNVLRRTRGGSKMLLEQLWPQLNMVVTLDVRMSTTALYSDFVLPISHQYEKIGFGIPSTHTMNLTFCDKAVDPPGEAVDEWEAFRRLAQGLEERARARGFAPFKDAHGAEHDPANGMSYYTRDGQFDDCEVMADEMLRDSALTGALPANASLEDIREKGYYRWESLGISPRGLGQATDPQPDETFVPWRDHVEKGEPYPTLCRRAQFLIEHEWFIEADEHLPRHKNPPSAGGDYPFSITSGHNRWSIHSLNIANEMMQETHRGTPHLVINNRDAEKLGIADADMVRVHNDLGEFRVPALLSASARPGQVIMYNGFEPYQFPNWAGPNDLEPGLVKWLHLAGGYGHLRYWVTQWCPSPVMRGTRVALEKVH